MNTSTETFSKNRLTITGVKEARVNDLDDAVQRRVKGFLASRNFPIFRTFDIDVKQGAVTLTGQVRSYYEKQIAITSCQAVAGVLTLIDRIAVIDSPTTQENCDNPFVS